jgi:5-formyltetrahydrofolate cyclo-ligase
MRAMAEAPAQRINKTDPPSLPEITVTPITDKKSLRKEIISRRDSIPPEIRSLKDSLIHKHLSDTTIFKDARVILFYASFRSEVSTENLIIKSLSDKIVTGLPRVDNRNETLMLYEIRDWSELSPGSWGILEPAEMEGRKISVDDIDIIIAPGVAFDQNCNRLGYGKGFYDKLLSRKKGMKPFVIGLAYEEQIVISLPCNPHDIKMDVVITDKRTITCNEPKKD